jgi:hypothetical protein
MDKQADWRRPDMKALAEICAQLAAGQFEFSRHAFRRAIERNISEAEIQQAGRRARMIEDYADDKVTPSCLLLGFTEAGCPLHMQVSRADAELVRIITLDEPDPDEWYNYSDRR